MSEKRRYRKISVRLWGDEKFNRLSRARPNAQTLFVYLLTGPHTNVLPGLFVSGEAALAEALHWPLPAFRRCFQELSVLGMALADWNARVVWLPKAVRYNPPENPNVVKAWKGAVDEIPECQLKAEASLSLKAFIEGFGEVFGKAFRESSRNQEQEQETVQEQETQTGTPRRQDSLMIPGTHKNHACCGRVCVPASLHGQLVRRSPLPEDEADKELRDWYPTVLARYEGLPILGADDFQFWRDRYEEWRPAPSTKRADKFGTKPARKPHWSDDCQHDPRCQVEEWHMVLLVKEQPA